MQAVIVAAGESSRFWPLNKEHKSLFKILGRPLIYWTARDLAENGIKEIIVVCGKDSQIPSQLGNGSDIGATIFYVYQEKPLGTGNALWQAKDLIRGPFFVSWPGKVNSKDIIAEMRLRIDQEGSECMLVGAENSSPGYGMIRMKGNAVEEIVEKPSLGQEPSNIKTLGMYYFKEDFFSYYAGLSRHHETDFIDAINRYIKDKQSSLLLLQENVPTLKHPWDAFLLLDILIKSPYFEPTIAPSSRVAPNVSIEGSVHIGENTVVKAGTVIEGPCFIGDNCEIGPSSVLRGPLNIEQEVKTGSFCEIKHSILQEGTHFHSGYIGDSVIGRNCRFGMGFAAANRKLDRSAIGVQVKDKKVDTRLSSLGVIVGDGTYFGIHTGTMPGLLIGSECKVYPGTLVFENLPDGTSISSKTQTSLKRS